MIAHQLQKADNNQDLEISRQLLQSAEITRTFPQRSVLDSKQTVQEQPAVAVPVGKLGRNNSCPVQERGLNSAKILYSREVLDPYSVILQKYHIHGCKKQTGCQECLGWERAKEKSTPLDKCMVSVSLVDWNRCP